MHLNDVFRLPDHAFYYQLARFHEGVFIIIVVSVHRIHFIPPVTRSPAVSFVLSSSVDQEHVAMTGSGARQLDDTNLRKCNRNMLRELSRCKCLSREKLP